jgi:hypothetical protein
MRIEIEIRVEAMGPLFRILVALSALLTALLPLVR